MELTNLLDQAGAGAGGAKFFPPSPAHLPWVDYFWTQYVDAAPTGRTWRIVPDLNQHLIFTVARTGSHLEARCFVVGARSRFADVAMANRIVTCGACLRGGALFQLTHVPSSDFTDRSISVEEVFGTQGKLLMEQLSGVAACGDALVRIAAFLSQAGTRQKRRASLSFNACNRVEQLAAQTGLPRRTLHARLKRELGLSPKRVLRIQRLHRALKLAQDRSSAWPQIAVGSGFADQAHMIREFVDLLGESPTAWRQRSHLPIHSIPRANPPIILR
jgi:AraC-like DNA-binding protein